MVSGPVFKKIKGKVRIFILFGGETKNANLIFHYFLKLFLHAFSAFFFAVAAAPAQERTLENIGFHSERIANFACRPFSRGTKKQNNMREISPKIDLKIHQKT